MLTRDDVIELFLVFLGRLPESEVGIEAAISTHSDRAGLITQLTSSAEYRDRKTWMLRSAITHRFLRHALNNDMEHSRPETDRPLLRDKILAAVTQIQSIQCQYQPVYGVEEGSDSPRTSNLLLACSFVLDHFRHVTKKGHVRLIDVGCNIGFVTFKLAETFPNIVGLDINRNAIELCGNLKKYTHSPAKFYVQDFIELMELGELDDANVDCVLLLNVVHQFIFSKGLSYVQRFMSRLSQRVDVIFVELANKQDYVAHGKDHLLPEDPAIVLSQCSDCRIELLKTSPRRLYKISRNKLQIGPVAIRAQKVWFSDSSNLDTTRKYYLGDGKFLKLFRFTRPGQAERQAYERERRGLLQMSGTLLAPQIEDWVVTTGFGAVLMEEISGETLSDHYTRYQDRRLLVNLLSQYLAIAAKLSEVQLYHNDMSAHNIYVSRDASIRMIDFEQTKPQPVVDPFAVMLWTLHDILSGKGVSYEKAIYRELFNSEGRQRVNKAYYPDFAKFSLEKPTRKFVDAAETCDSWFEFVALWQDKLKDRAEVNRNA